MRIKNKKASIVITVVALALIVGLNFIASVSSELTETSLVVKGVFASVSVDYDNIKEVELVDEIDYGTRVGVSTYKINSGKYTNSAYGTYQLYAFKNTGKNIVVHCDDASIIVFNKSTAQATIDFYTELLTKINN